MSIQHPVFEWVQANAGELSRLALERENASNQERIRRYREKRWSDDPAWKRMLGFRSRFTSCLLRKWAGGRAPVRDMQTSKRLFGCSWQEMRDAVEKQFQEGMTWENHGKGREDWCLDHKRPICLYDWWTWDGLKEAFHWSNVQPLWGWQHRAKTDHDNTLARQRRMVDQGLKERLKPVYAPDLEGTDEQIMAELEKHLHPR